MFISSENLNCKIILNYRKFFFIIKLIFSAESWPQVFDDTEARNDWGWSHKYDMHRLVETMIQDVSENFLPKYQRLKEVNSYA